jgi:neutral ceramidase
MRALILTLLTAAFTAVSLCGAQLRAGVAKIDLEPPLGAPMAGYGTARFAKSVHDPIEARVLALSDGSRNVAFVTLDLCFTLEPLLMDQIRKGTTGSVDEVIFNASHTHSGPTYAEAPEAAQHAAVQIIQAIQTATKSLVPVRAGTGWGQAYIGFNRRYIETDGAAKMFWRNEPKLSSTFPVDPTVGVIRFDRSDGTPLAILVNYACHPVTFGPDNVSYSADYPSEMRHHIEQEMGAHSMAFFLQGAAGDINPFYDKTPLIEDAEAVMKQTGQQLGKEAARVAQTVTTHTTENASIQSKTVVLSVRNRWDSKKLEAALQQRYHASSGALRRLLVPEMSLPQTTLLLRFGAPGQDLAFVGMPGEPFVEFQMQLRTKSPIANSYFLGYTNGYFAYLPTIAAAVRGGYGANSTVNPTEVGTGEQLFNTGLISIYELLGLLKEAPGKNREYAAAAK